MIPALRAGAFRRVCQPWRAVCRWRHVRRQCSAAGDQGEHSCGYEGLAIDGCMSTVPVSDRFGLVLNVVSQQIFVMDQERIRATQQRVTLIASNALVRSPARDSWRHRCQGHRSVHRSLYSCDSRVTAVVAAHQLSTDVSAHVRYCEGMRELWNRSHMGRC